MDAHLSREKLFFINKKIILNVKFFIEMPSSDLSII